MRPIFHSQRHPKAESPRAEPQSAKHPWRGAREVGCWLLALGAVLLWRGGYPPPHVDDLFFTGASVELATHARLTNPWLLPWLQSLGTERFFCLPPVLPYALGLWLKCFGVSTASLTAFHVGVQLLLALLLFRAVRLAGGGPLVSFTAAVVAWLFALDYGMRPDALAVLLIALGSLAFSRSHPSWWVAGGFLSSSAALVHPLVLAFIAPIFLVHWFPRRATRCGFCLLVSAAGGIAVAFGMFLIEIEGRLKEFLGVLSEARSLVSAIPWYARPREFIDHVRLGHEGAFYGAMLAVVIVSAARTFARPVNDNAAVLRRLWWGWAGALLIGILIYPGRALHYVGFAGLVLAIASWAGARRGWLIASAALGIAASHDAGALWLLIDSGKRSDLDHIRRVVQAHPGKVLCIDEVAMRFVFDFRPPELTRDWLLRRSPKQGTHGLLASKPENELWIVNEWKLERYVADAQVRAERLQLGPLVMNSMPRDPYLLRVLP